MVCKYKYNNKWFTEDELIYLIGEKKNLLEISNKQALDRVSQLTILFKENPELQSIGNIFDYDSYLDTIFPDSKVKDIVYHGTDTLRGKSGIDKEGFKNFVKNNQFQQKRELENDLSKIQSENSYRRGENLDIPRDFKLLWSDTTNGNELQRNRGIYNTVGSYSGNSILGETDWGYLRKLYLDRDKLSPLEREQLFTNTLISLVRSTYGNTFNKGVARKLGGFSFVIVNNSKLSPISTNGTNIFLNINESSSFINHIFSNTKEGDEWDLLDTMVSEELIHLVSVKLSTPQETVDAYNELTQEDKLTILQTYYHDDNEVNTTKLSKHQYVHEYVRMQIQKKVLGSTTEEKRTALAKIIDKVWNYLKDLLKSYTSLNSIYNKTLHFIETGEGEINTGFKEELGIAKITKNDKVDFIYDKITNIDSRMILHPETSTDKRHYTLDGERIAKSVTEKAKENKNLPERTPEQKVFDDMKRDWGIEGHAYLENYITQNLIDENGYILKTPLKKSIETPLDNKQIEAIESFAKELMSSYKDGTRILVEKKVVNENVKGKLASTVDFLAIEPQDNGEVKVDILDWKFTDIDKNRTEDIPW